MKNKVIDLRAQRRKAYSPTDSERQQILATMTSVESLEGFGFYECVAADSKLDRQSDVLSKSVLDAMAIKYAEGRSIVHQHSERTVCGRTFSAAVQPEQGNTGHYELIVKFYISPIAQLSSGINAKQALDHRLIERVSISFMAKNAYSFIEEESGSNLYGESYYIWDIKPENVTDPNKFEVHELSLVTMGAQAGAVIKDIEKQPKDKDDRLHENNKNENIGNMKYKIASLGQTVEVNEETKTAIELLEGEASKVSALEAKLKSYTDKEDEAKQELVKEFVAEKVKRFKDLNADAETAKAMKLSVEEIKGELVLIKSIAIEHTPINPNPNKEEKNGEVIPFLNI